MEKKKNSIDAEMARISNFPTVTGPIGAGKCTEILPNGPNGSIVMTGSDLDKMVSTFESATWGDIKGKKLHGLVAIVEAQNLRWKHFAAMEMALFCLQTPYAIEVVKTEAGAEEGWRVSILYSEECGAA